MARIAYYHLPNNLRGADVQEFRGNTNVVWAVWQKPRGCTMATMLGLGGGGAGGTGVIGANSVSAGGGGGASGNQTRVTMPLIYLPDVLYVSAPGPAVNAAGAQTSISIAPDTVNNNLILRADGGNKGGNAAAGTGGSGGTAASVNTLTQNPLAATGIHAALAGQAGIIGGGAVSGGTLTIPVTGLVCCGGTGGGGLPAAAATGTNGGSYTVPAAPSQFPPQPGGQGSATATVPADLGAAGIIKIASGLFFSYGGTGGASTHGTATGGGLVQGRGGDGIGWGCGGGGMGGALTGSSAAVQSLGGPGYACIICW
jgi:hypothetical protein